MTANRPELKDLFSDGKLPTGDDFAELIDSMVHQDEFSRQKVAFDQWTTRGEVQLGAGENSWRLFVDDQQHVHLQPGARDDDQANPEPKANHIRLDGWTSMGGRLGNCHNAAAFAAETSELVVNDFPNVESNGAWQKIVDMPGHACAFEVTAATARQVFHNRPGAKSLLRWLAGMPKARNSVVHTVVTATGLNEKPLLSARSNPDSPGAWKFLRQYLVALFLVLVATSLLPVPTSSDKTGSEPAAGNAAKTTTQTTTQTTTGTKTDPSPARKTGLLGNVDGETGPLLDDSPTPPGRVPAIAIDEKTVKSAKNQPAIHDKAANPETYVALIASLESKLAELEKMALDDLQPGNLWSDRQEYLHAFLIINLLYALRLIARAIAIQRNSVRLKWVRSSGGLMAGDRQWELKLRGPAFEKGSGDNKVYYHITKLWN